MKSIFVYFLFILVLFSSCKKKENIPVNIISFINSSDTKIKIKLYNDSFFMRYDTNYSVIDSVILNPSEIWEYANYNNRDYYYYIEDFFNRLDSVQVVYNDTLSIYHGSKLYKVKKSIKNKNSFTYRVRGYSKYASSYHYEYFFTNADFEEAKTINGL